MNRIGGDEFACMLRETGTREAWAVAERARRAIEQRLFRPHPTLAASVSAGLATQRGVEFGSADAFIDMADRAFYAAKEAGRNRAGFVGRDEAAVL